MKTLKVLSLNTHKGFNWFNRRFVLHELREAIRSTGADLVCLQEVLGQHDLHKSRHSNWPAVPQYEFMADSIWPAYAYGRNAVYTSGHHGNAVLSRYPILSYDNHDISIAGPERRGILHCVIQTPGQDTHAFCTHFGLIDVHRVQQAQLLSRLMAKLPASAPLIVAGDFNDWRQRIHRQLTADGLQEAFEQQCGRVARTFPALWPVLRLDRIYLKHARVRRTEVLATLPWSRLSDHVGLLAEVDIGAPT